MSLMLNFKQKKEIRTENRFPRSKPVSTVQVHEGCSENILRYVYELTETTANCVDGGEVSFDIREKKCLQTSCPLHERYCG